MSTINIIQYTILSDTRSTAIVTIDNNVYTVSLERQPSWHLNVVNSNDIHDQESSYINGAEETLRDNREIHDALDYYFNIQYLIDLSYELGHD